MWNAGYEVIRYEPRFREAVLALQQHLWSPDRATADRYLAWKYEENPWAPQGGPRIYLALAGGEVVGMRGLFGSRWTSGDRATSRDLPCAGDLVIAPEHRDRGLFTRLMAFAAADVASDPAPYLLNLSASPATRLGSVTIGWRDIGPLERVEWIPPRSLRQRVTRHLQAEKEPPRAFAIVDRLLRGGDVAVGPECTLSRKVRPAAMAELVRRLGLDVRIRHVRDEAWFAWRFRQPLADYRFLYLGAGEDRIEGYAVMQCRAGSSKARIVDLEATRNSADALLAAATTHCGIPKLSALRAGLAGASDAQLQQLRCTSVPVTSLAGGFSTVLVYRNGVESAAGPWELDGLDVLDPRSWDLRESFGDGA